MQRASTKETIVSTLHDFGNQSPGDPTTINSMVTRAKKAIDTYTEKKLLLKKISVATLLHSLIDFAIDGGGKHYVAYAILACEEEEEPAGSLVQLAQAWLAYLLYPVKASGGAKKRRPSTTQTPNIEETAQLIESATRGDQKAFRKTLRLRQGNRCAITGSYGLEVPTNVVRERQGTQAPTIACHILPFSLNDFQEGSESFHNAVITWDMIAAWGSFDAKKLAGPKINGPSNGLLLSANMDPIFSGFKVWFEKTDRDDTYVVKAGDVVIDPAHADKVVTFVNEHSKGIDLPDPQILELHAAFSRVLHLTGAGEYFEAYWRDMDEIGVLAPDGSTRLDFLLTSTQLAALTAAG